MKLLVVTAAAAIMTITATSADAASLKAASVTFKKAFSFTNADLITWHEDYDWDAPPASILLPRPNPGRNLTAAQFSVTHRSTAKASLGYDDFFPNCDEYEGEDENIGKIDGVCFYQGFEDIIGGTYISIDIDHLTLGDYNYPYLYWDTEYFFVDGLAFACLEPYWANDPSAEPFDLEACARNYYTYGVDYEWGDFTETFEIHNVDLLAGIGPYAFLIDVVAAGDLLTPAILIQGTASITYTYAPIPLPAALPLLLGGIGAMGLVARRRRRG